MSHPPKDWDPSLTAQLERAYGMAMRESLGIRNKIVSRIKDGKQIIHLFIDTPVSEGDIVDVEDSEGNTKQARIFHVLAMDGWDDRTSEFVPTYDFWAEIVEDGREMSRDEWDELYGEEQAEDAQEIPDEDPIEEDPA